VAEKREWSDESALEELRRRTPEAATVADQLLRWGSSRNLGVSWGSGAKTGYLYFVVTGPDGAGRPFGFSTDGKLDLYPKKMRRLPPFDQDQMRLEFVRQMAAAVGIPVGDEVIDQSFKSFPLDKLSQPESYEAAVAALDWFVEQTGARTAST
jgi:hypothetical protein